ncbi:VPLPA-CTERM sorting domain-containing protein [bacterium]|nr:VPLPA-CTERM sorting domain-containing protein [bacterium]
MPLDSLDPPTIYYQGDTVGLCEGSGVGAVLPNTVSWPFQFPWNIGPKSSNPAVYWGVDVPAYFSTGDKHPLIPGIIMSLTLQGNTPFSLDHFQLAIENPEGVIDWYDFNFIGTPLEGCREGGMEYTFSVVPIPGSLVLLGSGLIGLIGLGRRRMRK